MTWKPSETCEKPPCMFEFNGFNVEPQNLIKVHTKCSVHQTVPDNKIVETCIEECQRKEHIKSLIYENGGKRLLTSSERDMLSLVNNMPLKYIPTDTWKNGVEITTGFDTARNLLITITGLTEAEKSDIRSKVDGLAIKFLSWGLKLDKIQIL